MCGLCSLGGISPDRRRNFRLTDKKRIVAEAMAPGASISGVARRYGIDRPLLCRWKRELMSPAPDPVFLPVTVSDASEPANAPPPFSPGAMTQPAAGQIIVERSREEIEVELVGGRRVRFAKGTEPAAVRAMVEMLEGSRAMMMLLHGFECISPPGSPICARAWTVSRCWSRGCCGRICSRAICSPFGDARPI